MSSRFNPGVTPRRTPTWCKNAKHAQVSGMMSPTPTFLNGYATWKDPTLSPACNLAESFCMKGDGTGDSYTGSAEQGTYGIQLNLDRIDDSDDWEIILNFYVNNALEDHESWHNFYIAPSGLFDTGLNERTFPEPYDSVSFQATG